jgi:cyclophilin family peptidyl-prolyl cis-trans isomerase
MEGVLETALLFAVISLCFGYIALFIADTNTKITQKSKPKETFVIENTNLNKYVTMDILQEDFMATDRKSRIVIELYTSVVPKTVENFYQICKTNSYAGVPFHRVINNFMIQGGDITKKDGTGGTSIYAGKPFNDENFTLKHDSEGLLSMANSGPNTNLSQFFITLAPAPHLDGKHVIFGKVIKGFQHIQNIGSSPVDFNDKPVQNISIVYTETGNNPIEDEEKPDILADDVSMNIPNPQRNAQPQVQESPLNNGLSSNSINLSTQSSFPNTEQTQSFPTGITSFQDSNTQFPEGISTFTDNTFEVTQW